MKNILSLFAVLMCVAVSHGASAYDVYISQRNEGNTASPTVTISPAAYSLFSFNVNKEAGNTATTEDILAWMTAPTSQNLASALGDTTGTGVFMGNINPTIQGYTLTGAYVLTYTAMPALEVNVALPGNTYSASGNVTFTYSNATPTAGTRTALKITADGTNRTITIPSTWSLSRSGNITSLLVPANTILAVMLEYTGARWEIYGDPVAPFFPLSADPNADRILFWDDSAGLILPLTVGTNLAIADTTLNATGGVNQVTAALQAMGSPILTQTVGLTPAMITAGSNMADGTLYLSAVYLPEAATITGVTWNQTTSGDYTADAYNGVGLYTYSAGTLTLVASSTNDGAIWDTPSGNTFPQKAFSSTYAASAGLHFIGALYNSSAQVTAPAMGVSGTITAAAFAPLTTNSGKLYSILASQASLPTPQVSSGTTGTTTPRWMALY